MKITKFKSIVKKVKSRGTCFIQVPEHFAKNFSEKEEIKVLINENVEFFCNIRFFRGIGFYVSADIALENKLFNKNVNVSLEKINGFHTKIQYDGRVYIPREFAMNNKLKEDNIILLECKTNDKILKEYCKVHVRKKERTTEYFCMFTRKYGQKTEGIFKIIKIFPYKKLSMYNKLFKNLLTFDNFAEISEDSIIIFHGNRVPIIINNRVNIKNLAYYLGCYFADGTKRGNDWGICASTFEQAKFYIGMHNYLIINNKISMGISFTDIKDRNKNTLKKQLADRWEREARVRIDEKRIRIINSSCEYSKKSNPFGSLVLKEHKQLSQIYYNRLLDFLFKTIKNEKSEKLALDFILGVLEGDGSVGADRGHLMITSNLNELEILGDILNYTPFGFRKQKEGDNKGYIFIGSLEVIRNISMIKERIFKYYPKRRKILKERLANTGCARFLLGKSKKTSNWLIGQLNNYGILDGKGNLTKFGKKIKRDLNDFITSKD